MNFGGLTDSLNVPREMTVEIAFDIGTGRLNSFYDCPSWAPALEDFPYAAFYRWGVPMRSSRGEDKGSWQWFFMGSLRDECFDKLEYKHAYLRGRLTGYSVTIDSGRLRVGYANSWESCQRFAKWAQEVLGPRFGGTKLWTITTNQDIVPSSIPMCNEVVIEADDEVIDYLKHGYIMREVFL